MNKNIIYPSIDDALRVYSKTIEQSGGGSAGILKQGGVEAILEFVQNDLYYPSFEEKLTYMVYSICTGHNFNDGNKRFSITLGAYFLYINEYYWAAATFLPRMEDIALLTAQGLVTKEQLLMFVRPIFNCMDFDEETKLLLLQIKSKSANLDLNW